MSLPVRGCGHIVALMLLSIGDVAKFQSHTGIPDVSKVNLDTLSTIPDSDLAHYFSPEFEVSKQRAPCWIDTRTTKRLCLPIALMLGNPKCGTTDMFLHLKEHPQIQPPNAKEPHYWTRTTFINTNVNRKNPESQFAKGLVQYAQHLFSNPNAFVDDPTSIGFEASASTIWDPGHFLPISVPQVMKRVYGDYASKVKFLVMIRNPTARLWSDYIYFGKKHATRKGIAFDMNTTADKFHSDVVSDLKVVTECLATHSELACNYLTHVMGSEQKTATRMMIGCYSITLKFWFQFFHHEQFFIIRSEGFFKQSKSVLKATFRFLEVDPPSEIEWKKILADATPEERRTSGTDHTVQMRNDTKLLLDNFYHEYNLRLTAMLHHVDRSHFTKTYLDFDGD